MIILLSFFLDRRCSDAGVTGMGFHLHRCFDCHVLELHVCYIRVDGKVSWPGTGLAHHPKQEPASIPPSGLGLLLLPGRMR